MTYHVKEVFYTLQGEGARTGRAAVFCRFAGCNLWSGREQDRAKATCTFCDTDFRGTDGEQGGKYLSADTLADTVSATWPADTPAGTSPYVVCTGGEPALQLDKPLIEALHQRGFEIAIETNGTLPLADGIDWICVSPKSTAPIRVTEGNELKLVFQQPDAPPERFIDLDFEHFFLQPLDDHQIRAHASSAVDYCKADPRWRLSVQTHKWLGIP